MRTVIMVNNRRISSRRRRSSPARTVLDLAPMPNQTAPWKRFKSMWLDLAISTVMGDMISPFHCTTHNSHSSHIREAEPEEHEDEAAENPALTAPGHDDAQQEPDEQQTEDAAAGGPSQPSAPNAEQSVRGSGGEAGNENPEEKQDQQSTVATSGGTEFGQYEEATPAGESSRNQQTNPYRSLGEWDVGLRALPACGGPDLAPC